MSRKKGYCKGIARQRGLIYGAIKYRVVSIQKAEIMKKALVLLALVFTLGVVTPQPAQAGWVEFFFPSLKKKEYDPGLTMQAPFAVDPKELEKPQDPAAALKNPPPKFALPENKTPLDQPHRDALEISEWLTTVSSDVLTFDKADYRGKLDSTAKYFTAAGRDQYVKFLTDNNIIKVLDSGKFDVRSFVQEQPLLLNEGAVNGTYRWLFEVPMMVSYMEQGAKDYKNLEPVNQRMILTLQVGRVSTDQQGMGVLIERVDGRVERVAKK
jgi:hypothetical protein